MVIARIESFILGKGLNDSLKELLPTQRPELMQS